MNRPCFRSQPLRLVLLLALSGWCTAEAQSLHRLTFKGTSRTVDSTGASITRRITDASLVREWAGRAGVTNFKHLVLAFQPDVDSRGDSIQVVNAKTGQFVTTAFPLFFPETAAAATPRQRKEKRFAYVFNLYQAEVSRGTAILTEQAFINKQGRTNRFVVSGEMQWYQLPEGTNALRFCSGTFKVNKPIKPVQ